MDSENSADHVFVDSDAEGQSDLGLWDPAGGPVRVETVVGTFAWSAFYENAAKLKA
jgi:hypothetical protein